MAIQLQTERLVSRLHRKVSVLHWSRYFESYNGALEYVFCKDKSCPFPPIDVRMLAELLATVAEKSARPRSVLNNTTAALGHMYQALDLPNDVESY